MEHVCIQAGSDDGGRPFWEDPSTRMCTHAMACMHTCTATTRVRSAHRPAVRHGGGTPTKNGHTACTGHAHRFTHRLRPSAYPAIGAPPCLEVGPALQPPRSQQVDRQSDLPAPRAREVADKCNFLFSSPALVRRHPCRRVLPSRQAGPAALGQDVRLVRKTGHLKIKCRQAGGGGAGGGKKCYECVKVGHIASRSMAVTGTQAWQHPEAWQ